MHTEGGWPKDVDSSDVEHKLRYRKKVEKDEEYMRLVKNLCDSLEHYIKQNNALDIYEEYFTKPAEEVSHIEPASSRTLNVYRYLPSVLVAETVSTFSLRLLIYNLVETRTLLNGLSTMSLGIQMVAKRLPLHIQISISNRMHQRA